MKFSSVTEIGSGVEVIQLCRSRFVIAACERSIAGQAHRMGPIQVGSRYMPLYEHATYIDQTCLCVVRKLRVVWVSDGFIKHRSFSWAVSVIHAGLTA